MGEDSSAWRGACDGQSTASAHPTQPHASWDLDVGDSASWLRALDICANHCPALQLCRAYRRQVMPGEYPAGVIWAGVPYSEWGQPLDLAGLRRLVSTRRRRTGRRPAGSPGQEEKRIS